MKKIRLLALLFVVPMAIVIAAEDEGKWGGQARASRDFTRKEMTGGIHPYAGTQATGNVTTSGSLSSQSYDTIQGEAKWSGESEVKDLTRKGLGE